jgi:N-acetylmuramoyl-L-alanine amidase
MLKNKVQIFLSIAALLLLINTQDILGQKKIKTIVVDAGHGGSRDPGAVGQYEGSLRSKEKDITLAISLKLVAELKKQLPDVNIMPTRTTDVYQDPNEKARLANEFKGDLFLCIHADSGPLKTGKRQTGSHEETRYNITYKKVKKKKVKISTPYTVTVSEYEYFKIPMTRNGTSVWIFAAHKTSDKLKAIMDGGEDFEIETSETDSAFENFDFKSPEGKAIAQIYAKRFQEKSDRLATLVNDEVDKTGRNALGVNQRQVGIRVLQSTNMPAILIETGFINNPEDERYLNSAEGQQEIAIAITKAVKRYKTSVEGNAATSSTKEEKKIAKIPAEVASRITKNTKTIVVKSDKVTIELYDDGEIDNDIVSLYFNNEVVVQNKSLTTKPFIFTQKIEANQENELILYADNLGTIPPNTALMIIKDGNTRYEVRLAADLKNNASVKFELKK